MLIPIGKVWGTFIFSDIFFDKMMCAKKWHTSSYTLGIPKEKYILLRHGNLHSNFLERNIFFFALKANYEFG